ncbi:hypothetical protein CBM2589_A90941 [Cupriavidus taiwanensis]|uniref:Uncharacterized protein n=1 Tax=Cupriavidus taiwanensis TaxID=164546 RepID=A0A976A9H2_9BURK|nr:hypothetical protein CBM2589_A90941 [Cupriavidus taiwanensis]
MLPHIAGLPAAGVRDGGWGVGMVVERAQSAAWLLLLALSQGRLRLLRGQYLRAMALAGNASLRSLGADGPPRPQATAFLL